MNLAFHKQSDDQEQNAMIVHHCRIFCIFLLNPDISCWQTKPLCALCPVLYGWHLMLTNKATVCIVSCVVWMTSDADKQSHCVHCVLCCMDDIWCWQTKPLCALCPVLYGWHLKLTNKTTVCIVPCVVWMTSEANKQNPFVHYVLCCMDDIWCWRTKPLCALCPVLYGWHLMLTNKTTVCIMSCVVWMTSDPDKQNHCVHYVIWFWT